MYIPVEHQIKKCKWCKEEFKPRTSHQDFCCKNCYRKYEKKFLGHSKGQDKRKYTKYKKLVCEECGFIPKHPCQLDVDHIDGNHHNNNIDNLQTLCANCHRLKTAKQLGWT